MFHVKHRTSGCRRIRWRYRAMNDGPAAAPLREWPSIWSGSAGRIRMRRQAIPHSKGLSEALLSTSVRNTPAKKGPAQYCKCSNVSRETMCKYLYRF